MTAKILLVDDSGLARRGMRQILESAGYEVVEADDGLSALERYFLEKPDVVLLDLVMKGMNGLDVLKKLQEMDATARVVVVSADIQDSSRALAEAGRGPRQQPGLAVLAAYGLRRGAGAREH